MKLHVYFILLLLIVPLQASLFNSLSVAGIKPDLALAVVYIIGLLTSPIEATIAGMSIGLVQDISSTSFIGMGGFITGVFGLCAGLLGRRVLDFASPSNVVFLTVFCLVEGVVIFGLLQVMYGTVPFSTLFFTYILPRSVYTAILGTFMIRFMNNKNIMNMLRRRSFQRE